MLNYLPRKKQRFGAQTAAQTTSNLDGKSNGDDEHQVLLRLKATFKHLNITKVTFGVT